MIEKHPRSWPWRRLAAFALKLALAGILLLWLSRSGRLDINLLARLGLGSRGASGILAGTVCVFCGQLLLAARLLLLLRRQGLRVGYPRALGLTLIGSFFGALLPGLVGGDAVKAAYLLGEGTGPRSRPVAAVMIDRVVGLYSLFLLGTSALVAARLTGRIELRSGVLLAAPVAVACLTAALGLMAWRGLGKVSVIARIYSFGPAWLQNLVRALRSCLKDLRLLAAAVGLSLANHVLVIMTFLLAGILLDDTVSPFYHFVLDPLAMVMNAVPLTPGGIGLAEGAFSFLFQAVGSSKGAAIGLLGRAVQYLAFAAAGSVALLSVRFRGKAALHLDALGKSLRGKAAQ